jgi:hypothetical protein
MKISNLSHCLGLAMSVIFFTACHKDTKHISPFAAADTLTQDVYTINSGGTASAAVVLAAPFSSTSSAIHDSSGLLLVMNQDGRVLKEKSTEASAFCFNRWNYNGLTRYTYLVNDPSAFRGPGVSNFEGYAVIADSSLNELSRVHFIPNGGSFSPGQDLDVHDFILISDDHYIDMAYCPKVVSNIPAYLNPASNVIVLAPVIQEVNKGVVVWQWDGSADTSFYANSVEGNNFSDGTVAQDYMHMNAMFIDPKDNNLICSFRNQDQIIKINRQTSAIVWRLGGKNGDFRLFSDQVFLRQHDPSLVDNNQTLMIFDNGDATLRPESRILELKLDEVNKKVASFKSFSIPEPFTAFMGSVQKNGDEYFIGGGTANFMLEVNYVTGQKVREFMGGQYSTYRAYSFPATNN